MDDVRILETGGGATDGGPASYASFPSGSDASSQAAMDLRETQLQQSAHPVASRYCNAMKHDGEIETASVIGSSYRIHHALMAHSTDSHEQPPQTVPPVASADHRSGNGQRVDQLPADKSSPGSEIR